MDNHVAFFPKIEGRPVTNIDDLGTLIFYGMLFNAISKNNVATLFDHIRKLRSDYEKVMNIDDETL